MAERNLATPYPRRINARTVRATIAASIAGLVLGTTAGGTLFRAEPANAQSAGRRAANDRTGAAARAGASAPEAAHTAAPPKYVARVNDDLIPWSVLAQECVKRHGAEVLDNLINKRLIEQECAARQIRVTSAEVDAEIERIAGRFRMTPEQWLAMLKSERDLSPEQYARDVIWPTLALTKLAAPKVQVSQEDLRKAFEANYAARVKARMIVSSSQRRAAELWEQAKANPDDFAKLASEHSEDPATRPLGGLTRPIARHSGNPELEEQLFALKPGEISSVIQVEGKWIIFKCEGFTDPVDTTLEEVRDQLVEDIRERKTQIEMAKVFQELQSRATIENYLAGTSTAGRNPGRVPASGVGPPAPPTARRGEPAGSPTRR